MGTETILEGAGPMPASASRYAPVIAHAPLPIIEVQGAGHIVAYVNAAFCRLVNQNRAAVVGRPFAEIVPGGGDCVPLLDQVFQTGEPATHEQDLASDPESAKWLYAMWPALDADVRPVGVIIQLTKAASFQQNAAAINEALLISSVRQHELTADAVKLNEQLEREILERVLAETALNQANRRLEGHAEDLVRVVAERTEKLRETVSELETFSYSIAHDMRAPLRGMEGFAQILLEDHADRLDAVARGYLERIASSAARMDCLIQEVIHYTRVSQGSAELGPVNLDEVVRAVIGAEPDWQTPRADVRIDGTLPVVLGHEAFVKQCVSNLVGNAVKFVAPGVLPCVRIWAETRADTGTQIPWPRDKPGGHPREPETPVIRIWFENNGIGVAAKDHDRIFRMFERINPNEQFEGIGMGLTLVRKALERMGGRIDFESEPGKGSRFWIELRRIRGESALEPAEYSAGRRGGAA